MRPGDAELLAHLAPGETMLWQGWPIAARAWRWTVPRLFLALVAAFCVSMPVATAAHRLDVTPWQPFRIIGSTACLAVLVVQATAWSAARRTRYAITDRQVLVIRTGWFARTTTLPRERARRAHLLPDRYGTGTIGIWLGKVDDGEGRLVDDFLDLGVIADPARPLALLRG